MGLDAGSIAGALGGAKKAGSGWLAKCPIHDDNRASLSITSKGDKILFKCHAGCDQNQLFNEIRNRGLLPNSSLLPPTLSGPKVDISELIKKPKKTSQAIESYEYFSEAGELLFSVERAGDKQFKQRAANGAYSVSGVRKVIYRLPQVISAVSRGETIYIVEGEKDVHTAESLGLIATTSPGGANAWKDEYAEPLRGANVIICPDVDQRFKPGNYTGFKYHNKVLESLKSRGASVQTFIVPTGKDLTDWVLDGGKIDQILAEPSKPLQENDNTPPQQELSAQESPRIFTKASDLIANLQPISWLIKDTIESDCVAQIFGKPGSGKSFVAISLACSVATGKDFFNRPVRKGAVFYIAGEGFNGIARRLAAWEKHTGQSLKDAHLYQSKKPMLVFNEDSIISFCNEIEQILAELDTPPELIVIDTFARAFVGEDENDAKATGVFLQRLEDIRIKFNRAVIMLVHHSGHGNLGRARGSSNVNASISVEYEIIKDESGIITMRNSKMKDAEAQPDALFRLRGVDLGAVNGEPISSAALEIEGDSLGATLIKTSMDQPVTAMQICKEIMTGNESLSQMANNLNVSQPSFKMAIKKMLKNGTIKNEDPQDPKSKLIVPEETASLISMRGGELKVKKEEPKNNAPWKRQSRADLDD